MSNMNNNITFATNESIKDYSPGSAERNSLKNKLKEMENEFYEIPIIIGGKEIKTGKLGKCIKPHDRKHVLAEFHMAGEKEIELAITSALDAWKTWSMIPFYERININISRFPSPPEKRLTSSNSPYSILNLC